MTIRDFIHEQPDAIERVFRTFPDLLKTLPLTRPQALWLVGSGTSRNALIATAPLFERLLGVPIRVEGPLAFGRLAPADGTGALAVVLSQSGASTTSVETLALAEQRGFRTLALTAERESPFARAARTVLPLPVGPEPLGPKTKGYAVSIAALVLLAHALAGRTPPPAPNRDAVARLVTAAETAMRPMADTQIDQVMVSAQGRHLGTALEGSLKVAEISGVASCAFDTEEAFHGRFHGLSPQSLALFLAADAKEAEMAEVGAECLRGLGITAHVLDLSGTLNGTDELALPWPTAAEGSDLDLIWAVVPFQWLAVHLAEGRGMRPEDMRYPDMSRRLRIKTGTNT